MVQNLVLWKRYKDERENMMRKNNGNSNTKLLWHGTKNTPPRSIYEGDGFNINYANSGMWGSAIYFAVNASYSCTTYGYSLANENGA